MSFLFKIFITFSLFSLNSAYAMQLLSNPEDVRKAKAGDKNLVKAQLQGVVLEGVDLTGADLTDANLSGARLDLVNLTGAKFVRTNMERTILTRSNFNDTVFDWANLSYSAIDECAFRNAQVRGTIFSHARLRMTKFLCSTFTDVSFANALFKKDSGFYHSRLTDVTIHNSLLRCFTIRSCSLNNVDFYKSQIELSEFMAFPAADELNQRINECTWKNIDFRKALIIDSCFAGHLLLLFDKEQRIPELKVLEPSWMYKLSVIVNPLHAAKRMLSESCPHNINSVICDANFEGAKFIGGVACNLAFKNCKGIDYLKATESCRLANVVTIDAQKGVCNISNS